MSSYFQGKGLILILEVKTLFLFVCVCVYDTIKSPWITNVPLSKKINSSKFTKSVERWNIAVPRTYKVTGLFIAPESSWGISCLYTLRRYFPYIISFFRTCLIHMPCFCKHKGITWQMGLREKQADPDNERDQTISSTRLYIWLKIQILIALC